MAVKPTKKQAVLGVIGVAAIIMLMDFNNTRRTYIINTRSSLKSHTDSHVPGGGWVHTHGDSSNNYLKDEVNYVRTDLGPNTSTTRITMPWE